MCHAMTSYIVKKEVIDRETSKLKYINNIRKYIIHTYKHSYMHINNLSFNFCLRSVSRALFSSKKPSFCSCNASSAGLSMTAIFSSYNLLLARIICLTLGNNVKEVLSLSFLFRLLDQHLGVPREENAGILNFIGFKCYLLLKDQVNHSFPRPLCYHQAKTYFWKFLLLKLKHHAPQEL